MASFRPLPLAMTLTAALILGACSAVQPLTAEEKEVQNNLDGSKYFPATRQVRNNIETQPLFAQAAFWGREYQLNPSDLESAVKLSSAVRKLGNPQRAIEIAQTTRALYPRDPYLAAEFAAALIASERALEAMKPLDEALRVAPNYARLWSLKGAALDQTEQYDLARKHYDRALRITPRDPNILANLGLSYALSGDPVTAETWLRRASALPGASPTVHQNLGLVLQLQGKTAEAEKLARLSRGSQNLPSAPVPAHQPASRSQTPQARPFQSQSYRGQAPQAYAPAPPRRSIQGASSQPVKQTQARLAPSDDLTNEQRNLLNQIAGNLNPQQVKQNQVTHTQARAPQNPAQAPSGYPAQLYAPQGYGPAGVQIQQRAAQSTDYASRGAARRRR